MPWLALLIVVCAVSAAGGYERTRVRYSGFEDQTVFVSLANWLAHDPSDPGRLSLRVGRVQGDIRWATDGWTYTQAAWAWSSGRPPADIIWQDVTPLFAAVIPLIWFALAYALTGRERAAALTAAAVVIFGLLTVDDLAYHAGAGGAFGQDALFELSTLRKFSSGVALPLALFSLDLCAERIPPPDAGRPGADRHGAGDAPSPTGDHVPAGCRSGDGPVVALRADAAPPAPGGGRDRRAGHRGDPAPRAVEARPDPGRQRHGPDQCRPRRGRGAADAGPSAEDAGGVHLTPVSVDVSSGTDLVVLAGLPLLGTTYILAPATIIYHPLALLAVGIGLLAGLFWRRSVAAGFLFATTAAPLAAVFLPGIAPLFASFATLATARRILIAVPIAASLGIGLDALLRAASRPAWSGAPSMGC